SVHDARPPPLPTLDGQPVTGTTQFTVTPALLVSIAVTPPNPQRAAGLTQQFTATGLFTDNSTQDLTTQVTWQSSNPAVATISNVPGSQGLATGLVPGGPLAISATSPPPLPTLDWQPATATTQFPVPPALFLFTPFPPPQPQRSFPTRRSSDLTGLFTDNSTQDLTTQVTWQSSNPAVATISNVPGSQGLATGLVPGGP